MSALTNHAFFTLSSDNLEVTSFSRISSIMELHSICELTEGSWAEWKFSIDIKGSTKFSLLVDRMFSRPRQSIVMVSISELLNLGACAKPMRTHIARTHNTRALATTPGPKASRDHWTAADGVTTPLSTLTSEESCHAISNFCGKRDSYVNIEMIKDDIWARLWINTLSCTTPLLEKRSFVLFEEGLVVHDYNIHK
jgi:hypothetical protein